MDLCVCKYLSQNFIKKVEILVKKKGCVYQNVS